MEGANLKSECPQQGWDSDLTGEMWLQPSGGWRSLLGCLRPELVPSPQAETGSQGTTSRKPSHWGAGVLSLSSKERRMGTGKLEVKSHLVSGQEKKTQRNPENLFCGVAPMPSTGKEEMSATSNSCHKKSNS